MGVPTEIHLHISGQFIEADETKWDRLLRTKIKPALQRQLRKTGEAFS